MGEYASPFRHESQPEEPPRGTVLAYQRLGHGGAVLDYVSLRAGDGRWYTTGRNTAQGVSWSDLWSAVNRQAVGVVSYAAAWSPLANPAADVAHRHIEDLRTLARPEYQDTATEQVLGRDETRRQRPDLHVYGFRPNALPYGDDA